MERGQPEPAIESLLLRIPLPTLYAAESGEESWAVVDGIQRLTTIARFVDPAVIGDSPLRLRGLEYLGYNDKLYTDLPGAMQTRIDETELIIHLIRAGTPEAVKFNIFARINTGGLALTSQELRHALIPGPARVLLQSLADNPAFLSATQHSVRHERMADREMVLRFLAFRITEPARYPRGDLDAFLREAMKQLNGLNSAEFQRLTHEFILAMVSAEAIFGEHAFRKRLPGQTRRQPINKALFEAVSVNLATLTPSELAGLRKNRDLVRDELAKLMEDPKFQQAISVGTGDVEKVRKRFGAIHELFHRVPQ